MLVRVDACKEDGADGDISSLEEERDGCQASIIAECPSRLPQKLVMYDAQLAKQLKKMAIRVIHHEVEGELFKHDFFVGKNTVSPAPVFLALLVDNKLSILLSNLGHCDYDVLRFPAVLLDLVGEEEGSRSDVLQYVSTLPLIESSSSPESEASSDHV